MTEKFATECGTGKRTFCLIRGSDMARPRRPEWLIPGIVEKGRMSCIAASDYGMCAEIALWATELVASGRPLKNLDIEQRGPQPVFYIDCLQSKTLRHLRARSGKYLGHIEDCTQLFVNRPDAPIDAVVFLNLLKEIEDLAEKPGMIVINNPTDLAHANVDLFYEEDVPAAVRVFAKRNNIGVLMVNYFCLPISPYSDIFDVDSGCFEPFSYLWRSGSMNAFATFGASREEIIMAVRKGRYGGCQNLITLRQYGDKPAEVVSVKSENEPWIPYEYSEHGVFSRENIEYRYSGFITGDDSDDVGGED